MELGSILKEGVEVLKKNYVLAVPTVIATFIVAILSMFLVASPEAMEAVALVGFVSMVLNYFAHGVTVAMAREALEKGQTSVRTGFDVTSVFFYHFFVAAIVLSAIVTLGFLLLVLPGLVAMLLVMFAFPAIVMKGHGPSDAIRGSYRLVRANMNESLLLFIILGAMVFSIAFVNMMLSTIPVVGQFISVVINGAFGGFSSVVLLKAYIVLSARTTPAT